MSPVRPRPLPARRPARRILAALLVGLLVAAGATVLPAAASAGGPIGGTIRGTVTSTTSGAPIPGALVEAISRGTVTASAPTDAQGRYAITGLPGRYYLVRMSAAGHETSLVHLRGSDAWSPIEFQLRLGEDLAVDFALRRLDGLVRGRVVDDAGRPLAGVSVVEDLDDGTRGPGPLVIPERRAVTDSDGRYALVLPSGGTRIVAERPDLVRRWGPRNSLHPFRDDSTVAIPAGRPVDVDFRLQPRPAHSCWAVGGIWIAGTTDQLAPSFPPDRDEYCAGPLAPPRPLTVANVGPNRIGDQWMDQIEVMEAIALPRSPGGRIPPAVRLLEDTFPYNALPPAGTPTPTPAPAPAATTARLRGASRATVTAGRFAATTSCTGAVRCGGRLRATVAVRRGARRTVATAPVRRHRGRSTVRLRLNATGRRLLGRGTLRVRLRWEPGGGIAATERTLLLRARR